MAIMAMTTSSSMRVKATGRLRVPAGGVWAFMVALTIPYFTMLRAQAVIEELVGIKGQVMLQTAVDERNAAMRRELRYKV